MVQLVDDIPTLKACSLTCYSWYIAALPCIHHTLVLRNRNGALKALSNLHALGLLPFTKEVRILQVISKPYWFTPQFSRHQDSRHFFALTNVRSLMVQFLDIVSLAPRLGHHFGHLSSALRSLTLHGPRCTALQLSYFISLFPNLDDVDIRYFWALPNIPGEVLGPWSTPKLCGKLALVSSDTVETWHQLATRCGLRFRFIHIWAVIECVPVILNACAKTLETLRIEPPFEHGMNPVFT